MSFRFLLLLALIAAGSGCIGNSSVLPVVGQGKTARSDTVDSAAMQAEGFRHHAGFANSPDRGGLVNYPAKALVRRDGAFAWHQVALSEEHAVKAIVSRSLTISTPSGEQLEYHYQRRVEHSDGNWTWFGKLPTGEDAIVTFGDKAVFGLLGRHGSPAIELTSRDGVAWLGVPDAQNHGRFEVQGDESDGRIPEAGQADPSIASAVPATADVASAEATAFATVDVLFGYTPGFTAKWGGRSQALTRLQNRVDITNQAYLNSRVNAQIRLVRAIQVDYPDNTSNDSALDELSATNGAATPAGLQSLRQARDKYGADLVSLVRPFQRTTQVSCGVAWIAGGGQTTIDSSDARYGYSVVSDGSDGSYYCRDVTLAHELGHNMGQTHNIEDAGSGGADAYSYGYRESTTSGFYTVMAYRLANSTQYSVVNFANPQVTIDGRVSGVADASDNARSLSRTMPLIAQYRAQATIFTDVTSAYWAFNFIESLLDAGVTTGCAVDPLRYCPGDVVRRDQMAVFLLRAKYGIGYQAPAPTGVFNDVLTSHWAAAWIERAYQEGITEGCQSSPLAYCPDGSVSREQMAVFLLRAKYGSTYLPPSATGVFADVPASHWSAPWIEQLAAEGITSGCSTAPMQYCPGSSVTRDQLAVFLTKAFNLP